ncbi:MULTISPECIES: hypothetical protein [Micromonospora]|uniref:Bacteriocin-protection, YdeI or OmpD-Associated n=1 Tax=Micromonospora humidisoli TaxID=2807622 RepID=A0ABS2JAR7_9ACTN|nr:hypothetical protein [Micromonospora humidisoli]MBM7083625.1 hypothetical protein [Micromonospora humidisoli]
MTDQTAPRLLTDEQLRRAAAGRPGYATYPEYAPGGPERLGQLPRITARRAGRPPAAAPFSAVTGPAEPVRSACPEPAPADARVLYGFPPCLIEDRPWWRRRWHWAVMVTGGRLRQGYAWTRAGARRRTARMMRQAPR